MRRRSRSLALSRSWSASYPTSFPPTQTHQRKLQDHPTPSVCWSFQSRPPAQLNLTIDTIVHQTTQWANGGLVLFGTDVGFVTDTSLELDIMRRALSESDVRASLTTNPGLYFKAAKKGRVEKGFEADFVILDGDPVADARNLAKVAYSTRSGHIIYQKP